MAIMHNVTVSDFIELDRDEVQRRCLARGLDTSELPQFLKQSKDWVEVRLSATACHPDASFGTSEEFFLRLLAEANVEAGFDAHATPVDEHFGEALWSMDFVIDEERCPLRIVELSYEASDSVAAVVLVPKKLAPNLGDVDEFESTAWDGRRMLLDEFRAQLWGRWRGELRIVQPTRRIVEGAVETFAKTRWVVSSTERIDDSRVALCSHGGATHIATTGTKQPGPFRLDDSWSAEPQTVLERPGTIQAMASDGRSLWLGTKKGLARVVEGASDPIIDKKGGLVANSVTALATATDGGVFVGTMQGYSLVRNGEVVESQSKGLGDKAIRQIVVAPNGDVWLVGRAGATRRNADGSLDVFGKKQGLRRCSRVVVTADSTALLGADGGVVAIPAGSKELTKLEAFGESTVVGGGQQQGVSWLVTQTAIVRAVEGQPLRAFVFADWWGADVTEGWLCDGWIYARDRRGSLWGIEAAALEAELDRAADNVQLYGDEAVTAAWS